MISLEGITTEDITDENHPVSSSEGHPTCSCLCVTNGDHMCDPRMSNFSNLKDANQTICVIITTDLLTDDDTDTLLANVTSRNKLLDDLMELNGFLSQRIAELHSDSDFPLAVQVGVTYIIFVLLPWQNSWMILYKCRVVKVLRT